MFIRTYYLCIFLIICFLYSCKQQEIIEEELGNFQPTDESAAPWVYWYWMHSAYSREGITADLEAMKQAGIGGAYLMSIRGPKDPPLIDPPIIQTSREWWEMVKFAMDEAKRLDLQLAMHASDGFAVAGGPWIKPEQSMQKVVWSEVQIEGGSQIELQLPQPETLENYYEDIATFALPLKENFTPLPKPVITTSKKDTDVSFLSSKQNENRLVLSDPGWFQYDFGKEVTVRSIEITTDGNSYQAHRMKILTSDDGEHFKEVLRLTPPRHGWQDWEFPYTHTIPPTTAKYFRFEFDPEGTEPGAEDLDAAKWKASVKVRSVLLSSEPKIGQYEGKSALAWRIAPETTAKEIPDELCYQKNEIINISEYVDSLGNLNWQAPEGNWKILRFGHTSTGHTNYTGGGGLGLEVDKFNADAVRFQFDQWFGEAVRTAGPELANEVLKIFHIDSWECASQNWSTVFQEEFKKRRKYDIVNFLPLYAGIPIENAQFSEQVLYDIRKTVSELLVENFFGTMKEEAHKAGTKFSSENVAPTFVSDALLHFKEVDYPGGEFWLKSPTHDKPNDMLDAISAGHIYGKNIIQAEAFTELRMDWDEHPGNLKTVGDLNYALGINRFFYHVFVHNPWLDRKPGMTLDNIGTYFQRDQTWWKPGRAYVEYCKRVQFQLQQGVPVVDLAVFTGEEIPSRSVLPDRLVPFLPGIFGEERVQEEKERMKNEGLPMKKMPKEANHSANSTDLNDWVDALQGYQYDSFNKDALLNAIVKDGRIYFQGENSYAALIFPGSRKMSPNKMMSLEVAEQILNLTKQGATIFIAEPPERIPGNPKNIESKKWQEIIDQIWSGGETKTIDGLNYRQLDNGKIISLPYLQNDFTNIDLYPDILFTDNAGNAVDPLAWTHRTTGKKHIFFLSNQKEKERELTVSFRVKGKVPKIYDPIFDREIDVKNYTINDHMTVIPLKLKPNASMFVIFEENTTTQSVKEGDNWHNYKKVKTVIGNWQIQFDPTYHGPEEPLQISELFDWSTHNNDSIRYYSGTAIYTTNFEWNAEVQENLYLHIGEIANIGEVTLNGKHCGIVWTYPYQVNISDALTEGKNKLTIEVTNTWANRLIGDHNLPEDERFTWRMADFRLQHMNLQKAGLFGPVNILKED